jgi:outer membrane protein OmpA-like peptidoglycan-associated protein
MSRWARALAAAGALAALTSQALAAGPPATVEVKPITFPVLPLDFPVSSLDNTVSVHAHDVTLQSDVLFAFNSARLSSRAQSRIAAAVAEIRRRKAKQVQVAGYTDSKGSNTYNLGLSRRRAQSVRGALAAALGSGGPTLSAVGFGEAHPVANNSNKDGSDNPKGRALNRRVEIHLR